MALSCELATATPHVIRGLLHLIETSPITRAPNHLLISVGALVGKIMASGATYYHLVVSDQATDDCETEVETAFRDEGVPSWRDSVIEVVHMPQPNSFFPGSTESTLYVIHPEVAR
ncbi:hypothetical protein [Streptomyces sp. G1]|uniref:hypothetical protein n=1 Tax=Streptomyces sp. G1 TaxID=361572 RepID=UPI002030FA13|nr:hypothetical protein [Streptomyces sp. G1]MCM1967811.1 hypothetical protein [Streptomyces sp. G1]